jgi:hypothetical protein
MTQAYKDAIANGKAKAKKWCDSYAKVERGVGITEIACACCGTPISALKEVGRQRERRAGNRTVVETGVMLTRLAGYVEVAFEMSDGSKHVTNACADCANGMENDAALREACYAMDLSQWSSEGITLSDRMCERKPVGVIKIAPEIGVL